MKEEVIMAKLLVALCSGFVNEKKMGVFQLQYSIFHQDVANVAYHMKNQFISFHEV